MILCRIGASYGALKAPRLVRTLAEAGLRPCVQLDEKARLFVGPSAFSGYARVVEALPEGETLEAVVYFPAPVEAIARLAHGLTEDPPPPGALVFVAPDLDPETARHPAVAHNIDLLKTNGCRVVEGEAANGVAADEVAAAVLGGLGGPLSGTRVVVTAGGTHEAIDSVRFIGNRSSGKMGLAVAREALHLGAEVTVVAANVASREPGVRWVPVQSVEEMARAVDEEVRGSHALIMAAALSDFTPASPVGDKIRREERESLTLELTSTPDVLGGVRERNPALFVVGFAATHGDPVADAREKLHKKGADLIVGNDISRTGEIGFGTDENEVHIVGESREQFVPRASKEEVARAILGAMMDEMQKER